MDTVQTNNGSLCRFSIAVLPPTGSRDLAVLVAAARAGELPLFDAVGDAGPDVTARRLADLREAVGDRFGLRVDTAGLPHIQPLLAQGSPWKIILISGAVTDLAPMIAALRPHAELIYREVINEGEADQALAAGVDGL